MCARRFLIFVFVLTLLAVAAAVAIFQFGQQVLIKSATPVGHFQPPPPNGPDYSKLENWVAQPEIADNPTGWVPDLRIAYITPSVGAAIFYVHPTTYLKRDRWNAPLSGDAESDNRVRLFVQSQASALTGGGRVWAPRYRQAAFGAFLLKSADAKKALDLAFSDVRDAFDQFLQRNPAGPIIVAGHSQGSLHVSRLLTDRRDVLKDRLVAAYVVGWPLSTTADLPAMRLPACIAPEQVGCVLSWQSFADPANPDMILDAWENTEGPTGIERRRKDMLCVNPITGTRDGAAPPGREAGTIVPNADFSQATFAEGLGAHCEKGFLIVDGEIPAMGPYVLPGNNYHVYDYALFWGAIREDAVRRLRAWRR